MNHSIFEPTKERIVIALGFFDSVHIGHRKLIKECVYVASQIDAKVAVATFINNPFETMERGIKLVYSLNERLRIFASLSVDYALTAKFDDGFRNLTADEYLVVLNKWNIVGIVCGRDYRFGNGCAGSVVRLQDFAAEKGVLFKACPDVVREGRRVSSSEIRKYISEGEIKKANLLLGEEYFIAGEVVAGRKAGRGLGFPTANICVNKDKLVPKEGVYTAKALVKDALYRAILHIGAKPTFGESEITVETHILDFSDDIYGKEIIVYPNRFLRGTAAFEDETALKKQIALDLQAFQLNDY